MMLIRGGALLRCRHKICECFECGAMRYAYAAPRVRGASSRHDVCRKSRYESTAVNRMFRRASRRHAKNSALSRREQRA